MPPRVTEKEMRELQLLIKEQHTVNENQGKMLQHHTQILEQQNRTLTEILYCIKGSETMNIEGMIPAQKRMGKVLDDLVIWKNQISFYLGIVASKKIWRFLFYLAIVIVGGFFMVKYGFWTVWKFFKALIFD